MRATIGPNLLLSKVAKWPNPRSLHTLANERRQTRRERMLPPLTHFGDHLTPAVLPFMNTALRHGEVLKLRWNPWTATVGSSPSGAGARRVGRPDIYPE